MPRSAALAVGLGGAAGATCRWLVASWVSGSPGAWPWPTLAVNVVGCLLLGYFAARLARASHQAVLWRDGLGTGFCGGLTTFSTLAVEPVEMLRHDRIGLAVGYVAVSLAVGFVAYELGRRSGHVDPAHHA